MSSFSVLSVLLVFTSVSCFLKGGVSKDAPTAALNTYDFTGQFQGGAGSLVTLQMATPITTAKSIVLTANYNPSSVDGACFAKSWGSNTYKVTPSGSSYIIAITATDSTDWNGKVTPGYLDLTKGCGLVGGNKVFNDVQYGVITSVNVEGVQFTLAGSYNVRPGNGKKITGYYTNWARYGKQFPASRIPYTQYNQIQYAFIGFDGATGNIFSLDSWADQNEMPTLGKARVQYPYLDVALSFGGWTNSGKTTAPMFDLLTNSQSKINTFASNAVRIMRAAGYNGIDIDWEWWSDYTDCPADRQLALYTALRRELDAASVQDNTKYYLSIAVVVGYDKIQAQELASSGSWQKISALVDYVNMMAYDMHGAFDPKSDFQAPWGMELKSPYYQSKYDIKECFYLYLKYGVPASKLCLGVPAYGRASKVASLDNYGLYQTITGTPNGDFDDATSGPTGVFLYRCIVQPSTCHSNGNTITSLKFIKKGDAAYTEFSALAGEPWGYGNTPQGLIFLSYDDVQTIQEKTTKVSELEMGGVMLWEIDGDVENDQNLSIVATINKYLV